MNKLTPASEWILYKYLNLEKELEKNLNEYQLSHNIEALYGFLWDDYADWYVEYLKTDSSQITFAKNIFLHFLFEFANYSPFQVEALWKEFYKQETELSLLKKPVLKFELSPDKKYLEFSQVINLIKKIRSIRGLFGVDLNIFIEIFTTDEKLFDYQEFLKLTAKTVLQPILRQNLYTFYIDDKEFAIDILRYIGENKEQEIKRTKKILESLEKQINTLEKQLSNANFLAKAGKEVVNQKKQDLKLRKQEKQEQKEKIEFLTSSSS